MVSIPANALPSPLLAINDTIPLQAAALAYARLGLPVFPLEPRGKIPLVPRGFYAATCEPDTIIKWWTRTPQANIGVPTGLASHMWVLDVDACHGGLASLKHLLQVSTEPLDATRVQLTGGGGLHLCYRPRDDLDVQLENAVRFAGWPGLDLRVQGGYIVVAPSVHRSGRSYHWQLTVPMLSFPLFLVEQWARHRQRSFDPSSAVRQRTHPADAPPSTPREQDSAYWLGCALKYGVPGSRHRYACFLACRLLDDVGLDHDAAVIWMLHYARQVPFDPDNPFTDAEALSCLQWAAEGR